MATDMIRELFSLEGRVALVTGASSGIGRELAQGLAAAGAKVALSGRSQERLDATKKTIVEAGGQAEAFAAELGELEAVQPLVDGVIGHYGQIDILINCAGMNQREPIAQVKPETYERIMNVNLRSAFFLSQAVQPHLIARGGGKVIHIGSLTTGYGIGNITVYGLSKSAIGQLTRAMAVEWAEQNIQVNCICPGWIETELTKPHWADEHRRGWILGRVPAKRPGTPRDLVGMAIYLASPASDFTTGQCFYIDGGFMAGGQW